MNNKINQNKKLKKRFKRELKICDNCIYSSDVNDKPSFVFCSKHKCIKAKYKTCVRFEFNKELQYLQKLKRINKTSNNSDKLNKFGISEKSEDFKKLSKYLEPKNKKESPNKHRKKLILEQKRGVKVDGVFRCRECKQESNNTWLYEKTSLGSVHICEECKPQVLDRTRGRIDVLDMPHSGNFEGNPRKH